MEIEHPTKLDRLMHAVAEHHPLCAATTLAIQDFGVRIESNSPPLIAAMRRHFAPFLGEIRSCDLCVVAIESSPPELGLTFQEWSRDARSSAGTGARAEYVDISGGRVVRKPQSGLQFLLGPDITLAVGACSLHPHQLIELVSARYMERFVQRGWLACQAAGAALGANGIALCGPPGSGKTTLALQLLARGAALLSSDRVMIEPPRGEETPRVAGVPSAVRVNPGTLLGNSALRGRLDAAQVALLERLTTSDLWALEDKRVLDVGPESGFGALQLMASLQALVVLSWQPARLGKTEAVRYALRDRPEWAGLIAKRQGPFCRGSSAGRSHVTGHVIDLAPYVEQLADLPVLELRGGVDFETAAEHCMKLLA